MDSISQKLEKLGILPVVSLANPQRDALPLAEALIRGGLPAVEVTFRMAGAAEAIRNMNKAGFLVIVVSNQSGVARGYFGLDAVKRVNDRINELLARQGAHVDAFYVCPHLKGGAVKEFDVECQCRKPRLGLFQKAIADFSLDPAQCYACGDRPRDVERLTELGIPPEHLAIADGMTMAECFPFLSD